jgi:RNA polymerase sigma-70 factor (ECF subfamily)
MIRLGVTFERCDVNGQPGAVFRDRDGKVLHTLALDVLDGAIQAVHSVINPDKLGHLGPLADPWEINREVRRSRREEA